MRRPLSTIILVPFPRLSSHNMSARLMKQVALTVNHLAFITGVSFDVELDVLQALHTIFHEREVKAVTRAVTGNGDVSEPLPSVGSRVRNIRAYLHVQAERESDFVADLLQQVVCDRYVSYGVIAILAEALQVSMLNLANEIRFNRSRWSVGQCFLLKRAKTKRSLSAGCM